MTYLPIQIFLITAIVIFALYAYRLRTILADRLILFGLSLVGIILIIQPNWSTLIAHFLGIGRGTDLILYLFIIFSLFRFMGIDSYHRDIDHHTTEIVRAIALRSPQFGKGHPLQNIKED